MRITDEMLQAKPKRNTIEVQDLIPLIFTGGIIGVTATYIALHWQQLNFWG